MKIEDQSQLYRPIYRQLTADAVPILNTDTELCPFETKGAPAANQALLPAEYADQSDGAADKTLDSTLNTYV